MAEIVYEYDDTGRNPNNLIYREPHVITEINSLSKRTLIPDFAPFYQDNFILEHKDSNGVFHPLDEKIDFDFGLLFMGAAVAIGKKVYGGVVVHRELLEGMVYITYRTLGGNWMGDKNLVLENLASSVYNPRIGTWDNVHNAPEVFVPLPHQQNLNNFKGLEDLIEVFGRLEQKLGSPVPPSLLYQEQTLRILSMYDGLGRRIGELESQVTRLRSMLETNR